MKFKIKAMKKFKKEHSPALSVPEGFLRDAPAPSAFNHTTISEPAVRNRPENSTVPRRPRRYSTYTAEECLAMSPHEEKNLIREEQMAEPPPTDDHTFESGLRYAEILERLAKLKRKRQKRRRTSHGDDRVEPEFQPHPIENFEWTEEHDKAFEAMLKWSWPEPKESAKTPPEEPRSPKWKPKEMSPLFDPTTMLRLPQPKVPVLPPNTGFSPTAPNYRLAASSCPSNPFARGLPANPRHQPGPPKFTSSQSAPQMYRPYQ